MTATTHARAWTIRGTILATTLLTALAITPAHAVDTDADEYGVAPPGTNLAWLYFIYTHDSEFRVKGLGKLPNSQLDSEIGIARYLHYFDVGGYLSAVQIIAPFGSVNSVKIGGQNIPSASGIADPLLAYTIWPINNPAEKRYLGFTTFLQPPIGSYNKNDALNLGNNRFAGTIQTGFDQGFGDHWDIKIVADAGFYSNNTEYTRNNLSLSETPTYQFQPWLRYKPTPGSEIAVGYSAILGGIQKVQGFRTGNRAELQTIRLSGLQFINPTTRLEAEVFHDIGAPTGFRRDIVFQVQILKIF